MAKFISLDNKQVRQVIEYLKNGVSPTDLPKSEQGAFVTRAKKFIAVDDELYFIGKNNNLKFFASDNAYAKVEYLTKVHRNGHRDRDSLRFILKEKAYGINDEDIMVVLKSCVACQARKNFNTKPEITPIKDKYPRDRYIADLVYLADKEYVELNGGYSYLLTAVDSFSRYAYVAPLKDRSAKTLKFEF